MFEKYKKSILVKNISWIFIGNVIYSLGKFVLEILVARQFSLNDNGILNYAASWIAVITAVCDLGFSGVITKRFAEEEKGIGEIIYSCISVKAAVSFVGIIILQVILRIISPGESTLCWIVFLQSLSTVFSSLTLLVYWFRYQNKADLVAILRFAAFLITGIWRLFAVYILDSITFYTIGLTAENLIFGVFLLNYFVKSYEGRINFSFLSVKKTFLISYPFIFSALMSTIYGETDKIMLKGMAGNSAVAIYSASLKLAGALSMIPGALIEGFRPIIMSLKNRDEYLYRKRFRQLYALIFWSSIAYGIFVIIFAKQIILFLYGEKYLEATSSLAIVVWYSAFSYFGAVNNMYMVAEQRTKWVQITTLSGMLCNIFLNYMLIPKFGVIGASIASLITQIVANFLMPWIIKDLRLGFFNMIKGIMLRDVK